jgi:hypothetical protein
MDNNLLNQNNNAMNAQQNLNAGDVQVLVDPTIQVLGMPVQQFLAQAEANGWPGGAKDDTLRAFAVMLDPNNQNMVDVANMIINGQLQGQVQGENVAYNNLEEFRGNLGLALLINKAPQYRDKEKWNKEQNNALKFINTVYGPQYDNWASKDNNNQQYFPINEEIDDSEIVARLKNNNPVNNNQININHVDEQIDRAVYNDVINNDNNAQLNNNVNQPVQNENANLIPINEPNKQVKGKNWAEFHRTLSAKGWKNAENDNDVRAFFNLCSDDPSREGLTSTFEIIMNRPDANPDAADLKTEYDNHIRNFVRDNILFPAKRKENYHFEEKERASVLYFQNLLNTKDHENFDFNKDNPAPVQAQANELPNQNEINNANNINNVNVNNVENQNVNVNANEQNQPRPEQQNQPQPQPQPQQGPELKTREAWTVSLANTRAESAQARLVAATLRGRGSDEYKNVREQFIRVQNRWKAATRENGNKIEESEILGLRDDLMNVLTLADVYLDKKYRDNDKSDNAKKRKIAVKDSFDVLEEQLAFINQKREAMDKADPPGLASLATSSRNAMKKLEDATLHFRGSDEYKEAREAFDKARIKINQLFEKYNQGDGREADITTDELDETRDILMAADDKLVAYSAYRDGNVLKDNTHDRLDAVNAGRTVIAGAIRKLNRLQAEKDAKQTGQNLFSYYDKVTNRNVDNFSNERGVHFGSKAYTEAKKAYGEFSQKYVSLAAKNNLTPRELEDLEQKMDEAEAKIDVYLSGKREKIEWDQKGKDRIATMRESKENIIDVRKKVKEIIAQRYEAVNEMNPADLQANENNVLDTVKAAQKKVGGSSVWNGGKDYDKALEAFDKTCRTEKDLDNNQTMPSRHALKAEIEELTKTKDAILTYVRRKEGEQKELEGKGKKLDTIGTARLGVMSNAYDCVRVRLDRAQSKWNIIAEADKNREMEQLNKLVNDRTADIPNAKNAADQIVAMKSSESIRALYRLSQQKKLTELDQKVAKKAVASLILSENIIKGKFKPLNPPTLKTYDTLASKIYESKEFTSALPKEGFDPDSVRNILVGKKTLEATSKTVLTNMQKSGDKNKLKEDSKIRENLQTKANQEKKVNPLL